MNIVTRLKLILTHLPGFAVVLSNEPNPEIMLAISGGLFAPLFGQAKVE